MDKQQLIQIGEKLVKFLRRRFDCPNLQLDQALSPLAGGYENIICRVQLSNGPDFLNQPLVLRLFTKYRDPSCIQWEHCLHETLNQLNFPVPKIHCICEDETILGNGFLLMDLLPGRQLVTEPTVRLHEMLAETHVRLHSLNITSIVEKLASFKTNPIQTDISQRMQWLQDLTQENPRFTAIVQWLIDKRPEPAPNLSLCHMDFHGFNILVNNNKVSGVLDWTDAVFADPEYDVANTMMLLTIPGKHLASDWQHLLDKDSPVMSPEEMAEIYFQRYVSLRPLNLSKFKFYRILRCVIAFWLKAYQKPALKVDIEKYIVEHTGISLS